MATVFLVLGIACLIATIASLLVGVIGMGATEFNRKYGNKLMRSRIVFQFLAVGFILLYSLLTWS